jgi:PBP1b-binding outer membrane lipoprotein LpoB
MILALLAAIAAAALFVTGVASNTDSAQSYGDLGLATTQEQVV